MIRVLVVDDHEPTRTEIVRQLATGGVIQVVGEAETSDQAYKEAQRLLPDVVLLDQHLPGLLTTLDLLRRLTALRNVKVLIYAGQARAAEVQDLLESGAVGYILKTDPAALVRMAILMVSRGSRSVLSPALPRHLTRLTAQERLVLRHLTRRGRLPQIAERMGISEAELEKVTEHLCTKLELASPPQLIKWAKKHGF